MDIRLAKEQDIPGILELLRQVGQVHHDLRPDIFRAGCLKYDEKALLELLKDEKRPVFVAVEKDFVAGYCFCVLKDHRGGTACTDRLEVYIDDLCVDENRRGTGVAKRLFAHVKDWAGGLGCAFVTLNVWCGNDRAMAFYVKAGMRPRSMMMEMEL